MIYLLASHQSPFVPEKHNSAHRPKKSEEFCCTFPFLKMPYARISEFLRNRHCLDNLSENLSRYLMLMCFFSFIAIRWDEGKTTFIEIDIPSFNEGWKAPSITLSEYLKRMHNRKSTK